MHGDVSSWRDRLGWFPSNLNMASNPPVQFFLWTRLLVRLARNKNRNKFPYKWPPKPLAHILTLLICSFLRVLKHRLHNTNHNRHRVINNVRLVFGGWSEFGKRKFLLEVSKGLLTIMSSYLSPQFKYAIFHIFICIFSLSVGILR